MNDPDEHTLDEAWGEERRGLGWHAIHGDTILDALRKVADGADPDEVMAGLCVDAEHRPSRQALPGDTQNAAAALAHMPRYVAVHENTLAKLDVAVAMAGSEGYDVDGVLAEIDEARSERDRATGVVQDAAPCTCRHDHDGVIGLPCARCQIVTEAEGEKL